MVSPEQLQAHLSVRLLSRTSLSRPCLSIRTTTYPNAQVPFLLDIKLFSARRAFIPACFSYPKHPNTPHHCPNQALPLVRTPIHPYGRRTDSTPDQQNPLGTHARVLPNTPKRQPMLDLLNNPRLPVRTRPTFGIPRPRLPTLHAHPREHSKHADPFLLPGMPRKPNTVHTDPSVRYGRNGVHRSARTRHSLPRLLPSWIASLFSSHLQAQAFLQALHTRLLLFSHVRNKTKPLPRANFSPKPEAPTPRHPYMACKPEAVPIQAIRTPTSSPSSSSRNQSMLSFLADPARQAA